MVRRKLFGNRWGRRAGNGIIVTFQRGEKLLAATSNRSLGHRLFDRLPGGAGGAVSRLLGRPIRYKRTLLKYDKYNRFDR
jgi:hypothetical protein